MKRALVILLISLSIGLLADWYTIAEHINERTSTQLFEVIEDQANSTTLQFTLDGFELSTEKKNETTFTRIEYKDEGEFLETGRPDLPRFSRMIIIPNQGKVNITINQKTSFVLENIIPFPKQPLQNESKVSRAAFSMDENYYNSNQLFPLETANINEPAIMRDYRVVTVTVNPFQYNPETKSVEVITDLEVTITTDSRVGINEKTTGSNPTRAFDKIYQASLLNYSSRNSREEFAPSNYLFIYRNNSAITTYVQELAEWKHQKGFIVNIANTSQTGTSLSSIKSYIQSAYNSWENPPEFICLIGDASGSFGIPTGYQSSGEGDHYYTTLDGGDILADAIIGRLSCNTPFELQTILAKIFAYEKHEYSGDTEWYDKAYMVGDPTSSGTSVIDTKRSVKTIVENNWPEMEVTENYEGNWVNSIVNRLNSGVSFFNYRGFGGMSSFDNNDIQTLNNGGMLPFALIITCNTGTFANDTSRTEAFLRLGSPGSIRGAIGSIGTATGDTHTCFNNCMDIGISRAMYQEEIRSMGAALIRGKLNLYNTYPENPSGHVTNFSYWNNLMGDPGLEIVSTVPQVMNVNHLTTIPAGTDYLEVSVTDENSIPIKDALITLLQGNNIIFETQLSTNNEINILPLPAAQAGELMVTVTKHNFITYQQSCSINTTANFIGISELEIDDDNSGASIGNENGILNPGELVELNITIQNTGTNDLYNVTGSVTSYNPNLEIVNSISSFGNISADSEAVNQIPFTLHVSPDIWNSEMAFLELHLGADGYDQTSSIYLVMEGPGFSINPVVNNTAGIIEPGVETEVYFELTNLGSCTANDISAQLICDNLSIEVLDEDGLFGSIASGETVNNLANSYTIQANSSILPGTQVQVKLLISSSQIDTFILNTQLEIGTVTVNSPSLVDNFGHCLYDDGDEGYLETPVYDWIEIDPNYGGDGVSLELNDPGDSGDIANVELPMQLTFYGESYDNITICSNGWITPGETSNSDFMNWMIPDSGGPSPIIAPFWDDLITSSGNVYTYYDQQSNRFIIEWSRLKNQYSDNLETFQVIISNKFTYPTFSGDNKILFQYHTVNNDDVGSYAGYTISHGSYATVGIENYNGTDGILYTYNNQYPASARMLQNEMAILFSDPYIVQNSPHLVINDFEILDDNEPQIGETIQINFELMNMGLVTAENVNAELSCTNEFITITNGNSTYNDIPTNIEMVNNTAFEISISPLCGDLEHIYLNLDVETSADSTLLIYPLTILAPNLAINDFTIDDGNNGILDPGETCSLSFNFLNQGHSIFSAGDLTLASLSEDVTLETTSFAIPDIASGESCLIEVSATVSIYATIGSELIIFSRFSNEIGFVQDIAITTTIAQVPIVFSEDFSSFPSDWTIEGGENWSHYNSNSAGGDSPEMRFYWSPAFTGTQRLISPIINSIGSNSIELSFRHAFSDWAGNNYTLSLQSTSDGDNWNMIHEYPANNLPPSLENITVSTSDVGSANLQIAWVFEGSSYDINSWNIDDVQINNGLSDTYGYLGGNVSLAGGSGLVSDLTVSAGNVTTHPNENGDFVLALLAGTYIVDFSLEGYFTSTHPNIEILPIEMTTLNPTLSEWFPFYPPTNLQGEKDENNINLNWEVPVQDILVQDASLLDQKATIRKHSNNFFKETLTETPVLEREMISYNIYKNSELLTSIDELNTTVYNDINLPAGNYTYWLTTVYDEGESTPSNLVQIDIVMPQPVNFTAELSNNDILLTWDEPTSEIEITGYEIFRNDQLIEEILITQFTDHPADSGTYSYYLKTKYGDYNSLPSDTLSIDFTDLGLIEIPQVTKLKGNYPNPFNPVTTISFSLHQQESVKLYIYDVKGRIVRKLIDNSLPAQNHKVTWDGRDEVGNSVASGIYFYQLRTAEYSKNMKLLLLK